MKILIRIIRWLFRIDCPRCENDGWYPEFTDFDEKGRPIAALHKKCDECFNKSPKVSISQKRNPFKTL